MNTKLSISEIECLLVDFFGGCRAVLAVPNVSWGLLDHEADLVIASKSNYLTEIEIKRSWADFLADFKKAHTHDDMKNRIARFYYAVPESIADKVIEHLDNNPEHRSYVCGVLAYSDEKPLRRYEQQVRMAKLYRKSNKGAKPLTTEEMYQLARLGTLRMWKMKEKEKQKCV